MYISLGLNWIFAVSVQDQHKEFHIFSIIKYFSLVHLQKLFLFFFALIKKGHNFPWVFFSFKLFPFISLSNMKEGKVFLTALLSWSEVKFNLFSHAVFCWCYSVDTKQILNFAILLNLLPKLSVCQQYIVVILQFNWFTEVWDLFRPAWEVFWLLYFYCIFLRETNIMKKSNAKLSRLFNGLFKIC